MPRPVLALAFVVAAVVAAVMAWPGAGPADDAPANSANSADPAAAPRPGVRDAAASPSFDFPATPSASGVPAEIVPATTLDDTPGLLDELRAALEEEERDLATEDLVAFAIAPYREPPRLADDPTTTPRLVTWDLPDGEPAAPALLATHGDLADILDHLVGQRLIPGHDHAAASNATLGGQYLRLAWGEPTEDGRPTAMMTTTLAAGPGDRVAHAVPLAFLLEELDHVVVRGEPSRATMIRVGSYAGVRFMPAQQPFLSFSWPRTFAAPPAGEVPRFDVPVAPRPFAIIDIERPSWAGPDWRLAMMGGASPESIAEMPSDDPDVARVFFFGTFDTLYSQVLRFAWLPPEEVRPHPEALASVVRTNYDLFGAAARFVSERTYRAPAGAPIERLALSLDPGVAVDVVRTSAPAIYERPRGDLVRLTFARPQERVTVVVVGRQPLASMQERQRLYPLRDASICRDERITIEGPPGASIMESGVVGLALDPDPVTRPLLRSNALLRTYRSQLVRPGTWGFGFFQVASTGPRVLTQQTRVRYFHDGIGVAERIGYSLVSGTVERDFPRPLVLELDRRVDPGSIELRAGDVAEPTTRTVRLAASERDPNLDVLRMELEWDPPQRQVDLVLGYRVLGFPNNADVPEVVPMAVALGAESRWHDLELRSDDGLHVIDVGEFLLGPQRPAPSTSRIDPEPARFFAFTTAMTTRTARPPTPPTLLRDAGRYAMPWD